MLRTCLRRGDSIAELHGRFSLAWGIAAADRSARLAVERAVLNGFREMLDADGLSTG